MLVNQLTFGFSDRWKNIQVSGIWEIHTDRNYWIDTRVREDGAKKKLDHKTDIICSGYAIEFLRRLQDIQPDSGSSDRPNDYDTFLIWVNRYELEVDVDVVSGYKFPDETGTITFAPGTVSYGSNFIAESNSGINRVYNVLHSPARVAARQWKWHGMQTFGLPPDRAKFKFQVGQYNTQYSSRIGAESMPVECLEVEGDEPLLESTDISVDILADFAKDYLAKPIALEFDAPQSLCEFLSMANQGTGMVRFTSGKFEFFGFIQDAVNKPEDPNSGKTSLTLLAANISDETGGAYSDGYSDGYDN